MKLRWKVFVLLALPSIILSAVICGLLIWQQDSEMDIGGKNNQIPLPVLVKIMALKEREVYFKWWIDKVVAPDISDPEEKIGKIFEFLCRFEGFKNEKFPVGGNVEQHEYYTLIKQYSANPSDLVRVFCVMVTIAGYQAVPFVGEENGKVIVRIPSSDKWFCYDLKNKTSKDKVQLEEEVKEKIRKMSSFFARNGHTRGEKNLFGRRIMIELMRSPYVRAVDNHDLIWRGSSMLAGERIK